jgi:hypothetical protein
VTCSHLALDLLDLAFGLTLQFCGLAFGFTSGFRRGALSFACLDTCSGCGFVLELDCEDVSSLIDFKDDGTDPLYQYQQQRRLRQLGRLVSGHP